MYYPYSENKGADQLRGHRLCAFVYAYAFCRFSYAAAHLTFNQSEESVNIKQYITNVQASFILFMSQHADFDVKSNSDGK